MRKIYFLSSCNTCSRIIDELNLKKKNVLFQDIKTEKITISQLEEMKLLAGSYEALFSRIAMKYRSLGLDKKQLTENDFKKYILEEYTFLKRPVILVDNQLFIGSSKSNLALAKKAL